jgi:predicted site-specific integrase-resolvase
LNFPITNSLCQKFISPKQIRQHIEVSHTTLHRWVKSVLLEISWVPEDIVLRIFRTFFIAVDNPPGKKKICYCRVSSSKQMDDLERQKNYFRSIYPDHQLVTDIGSGINWKRKGLQAILEQAMSGVISKIGVAHRYRLCRFAFELLESIFSRCQVKLVLIKKAEFNT